MTKIATVKMYLVAALLCASGSALANSMPGTARCGRVDEISQAPANFIVNLTDKNGNNLVKPGWPRTLIGQFNHSTKDWRAHTQTPCLDDVFDARNTTIAKIAKGGGGLPAGGAGGFSVSADLALEAVFIDSHGQYPLENIWGAIDGHVGSSFPVPIPDLYLIDNGLLVPDSTLYSLVDLNIYLHDIPSFQLGDSFTIVNGTNSSLPGMLFSTTPFTFDPANGFAGTPFTGDGYTLTDHVPVVVPEPSTLTLFSFGIAGLSFLWCCRRQNGQRP